MCSPKSNPCTRQALDELKDRVPHFDADFTKINNDPEQWEINFWGAHFPSKSYAQEKALIKSGKIFGQGRLEDYALIIRAENPWNPETRLIIIAGIRGIGTWGAARYLRSQIRELLKRRHGKDFAAVIHVEYNNYKIPRRELINALPLSGPEQSQSV